MKWILSCSVAFLLATPSFSQIESLPVDVYPVGQVCFEDGNCRTFRGTVPFQSVEECQSVHESLLLDFTQFVMTRFDPNAIVGTNVICEYDSASS